MDKVNTKKLSICCMAVILFTLLASVFVKIIFFPMPNEAAIKVKTEKYIENNKIENVSYVDVYKTNMLKTKENLWCVSITADLKENMAAKTYDLLFDPISGKLLSEEIFDDVKIYR